MGINPTASSMQRKGSRRGLLYLALASGASFMAYNLHKFYAWQIILLVQLLPASRKVCGWPNELPPVAPSAIITHLSVDTEKKPTRFGILMLFDDGMSESEMTKLSMKNKRDYADRHRYELVVAHGKGVIDESRPAAWSKFLALRQHLPRFDYLFFMDVDTLIMNDEIKLEDLVARDGGGIGGGKGGN